MSAALALPLFLFTPQGYNVDIDFPTMIETSRPTYPGAAGQPGVWNSADPFTALDGNLIGLDGLPTAGSWGLDQFGIVGIETLGSLVGEHFQLYRDGVGFLSSAGTSMRWTFANVSPGVYEVYTYGWSPVLWIDNSRHMVVSVVGALDGPARVGGHWLGEHEEGPTYSRHTIVLEAGDMITVDIAEGTASPYGVSGFQIVPDQGAHYCLATPNSTGSGAAIAAVGPTSVALNGLELVATPVPDEPGVFFYGPAQSMLPFGDGFRCVDGAVARLPLSQAEGGALSQRLDVTQSPNGSGSAITAGSSWNFQAWFHDPAAGGAGFNLSDAIEVLFEP